jgi:hypothetical protein
MDEGQVKLGAFHRFLNSPWLEELAVGLREYF